MARRSEPVVVDGIEVSVSGESINDIDVIEAIADCNDQSAGDIDRMCAAVRLLRLVFGEDYARIKGELRKKRGGRLTPADMTSFFNAVCEAIGSKN